MIPCPFTRVAFAYGEPIRVPREVDEPTLEALRKQVEEGLRQATSRAEEALEDDALWKA
jgi:lysophospholipid acyltransferase (LPLAT)-like uncharacterized protein